MHSFAFSQGDELYDHGLNQNKWEGIRNGIRYEGQKEGPGRQWTYENDKAYQKELKKYENGSDGNGNSGQGDNYQSGDGAGNRPKNYTPPPQLPNPKINLPNFSGLGALGYIFLIVFIVAIAILIYYLFVNTERKGAKVKSKPIDFEEIDPTEIPLTELELLLQKAVNKGDYRGAVRIYFIFIVRGLAQRDWINWKKEKTNFHYLREMEGKEEYNDFNTSVSYFEFIWYGKRNIDATKFEEIKPKFTRFLDKLGVK